MTSTRAICKGILGTALMSLSLSAFASASQATSGSFARFTFSPYANNELTKAEVRSRFWGTVTRKTAQILSRVFRLNTIKGDKPRKRAREMMITANRDRQIDEGERKREGKS